MKKIILLIFFCILLTGCTAEYNLTYENNIISESLNVTSEKSTIIDGYEFKAAIDEFYNNNYVFVDYRIQPGDMIDEYLYKYDIYNKNIIDRNGMYGINLNYMYKEKSNYNYSAIAYSMFENIKFNNSYISVSSINNIFEIYPHLNKINISFKTDKKVLETNADNFKNNIYYWEINKNNYQNKIIKIKFDDNENLDVSNTNQTNWNNIINVFLFLLGIGVLIFVIIIHKKIKNSNK